MNISSASAKIVLLSFFLVMNIAAFAQSPNCKYCEDLNRKSPVDKEYQQKCLTGFDTLTVDDATFRIMFKPLCEGKIEGRYFSQKDSTVEAIAYIRDGDTTFNIFNNGANAEMKGGSDALMKYLQASIVYPKNAMKKEIQGRVVVYFEVASSGKITNVRITKGVHEELDNEALRVIKAMPDWTPATYKGVPRKTRLNLPISFRLN